MNPSFSSISSWRRAMVLNNWQHFLSRPVPILEVARGVFEARLVVICIATVAVLFEPTTSRENPSQSCSRVVTFELFSACELELEIDEKSKVWRTFPSSQSLIEWASTNYWINSIHRREKSECKFTELYPHSAVRQSAVQKVASSWVKLLRVKLPWRSARTHHLAFGS